MTDRTAWYVLGLSLLVGAGCGERDLYVTTTQHLEALHISAPDGRVEVPYHPELDVGTTFTYEAWIYMVAPTQGILFNKWQSGIEDKLVTLRNQRIEVAFFTDPTHRSYSASTPSAPSSGQWHHLAVSVDVDRTRIFVDGRVSADVATVQTIANAESPFVIGASVARPPPDDPRPADVYFSDVRISSSPRYTVDFVPVNYLPSDAQTIALWRLDEGAGAIAKDSGSLGMSGAVFGATEWVAAPARD